MKKEKIIRIILTVIVVFTLYYLMLPPLNINSMLFWMFLLLSVGFYFITAVLEIASLPQTIIRKFTMPRNNKTSYVLVAGAGVILLIILINFINSPLFMAKEYHNRIVVNENGNFINDVKPVNFNSLPLLDKESSQKLGDRVMGQMPELVSQFYVSNLYTQINYNNDIVRVTPLEYNGFFKYLANQNDGVKGYITVNSVTGESKLTKLDKGMKYMPSAFFSKDLDRHLRFKYPTLIFGEKTFEIDNEGNPYWIVPILKYSGVGLREEVSGAIILNPITGESKKYAVSEVPTWVDHVYSAELVISQFDDWGQYKNGFFNSLFGQKGVVMTTEGYNYLAMNDDIYMYTGVTSAASDEANLGFILTNLRTKETIFYSVPGAEEFSAMASAEGQVQQMNYIASFPLLINLNNKPTYVMSLKDYAGLVKMYAFVDVADYQKVVVTDASEGIVKAAQNYLGNKPINNGNNLTKNIKIKEIENVLIDGNSYYYIKDTNDNQYRASIKVDENILPFIKVGDTINVTYEEFTITNEIVSINQSLAKNSDLTVNKDGIVRTIDGYVIYNPNEKSEAELISDDIKLKSVNDVNKEYIEQYLKIMLMDFSGKSYNSFSKDEISSFLSVLLLTGNAADSQRIKDVAKMYFNYDNFVLQSKSYQFGYDKIEVGKRNDTYFSTSLGKGWNGPVNHFVSFNTDGNQVLANYEYVNYVDEENYNVLGNTKVYMTYDNGYLHVNKIEYTKK